MQEYIRTGKGYIFYNLSSKQINGLKLLSKQYGNITKHNKNIIDLIQERRFCKRIQSTRNS